MADEKSRRIGRREASGGVRAGIKGSGILVTGGAGFLGSNLVDRLLKDGAREVAVMDNMFLGRERNLRDALSTGRVTLYKDDACFMSSLEYIFARHKIDVVFNCATKALNYSFLNPMGAFETNTAITLNLLELQRRGAFRTLCHFSTSEVFGTAVYEPMDEIHPRNPTTAYAAGKAAADLAVEAWVRMFGVDAFIVRPFNNYGTRQNHLGYLAAVIPVTIRRIYCGEKPEIHGSGKQSRDFIFADDTIDAVMRLYTILPAGDSVNISTDGQMKISDVVNAVCKAMNYSGEILRKDVRSSDVFCHNASNRKVRSLIDFKLTPFETGLKKTVKWYTDLFDAEGCLD